MKRILAALLGATALLATTACEPKPPAVAPVPPIEAWAKAVLENTDEAARATSPIVAFVYWVNASDHTAKDPRVVPRVKRNVSCAVNLKWVNEGGGQGYGIRMKSGVIKVEYQALDQMAFWFPTEWYHICHPVVRHPSQVRALPTYKFYQGKSYPNVTNQVPKMSATSFSPPGFGGQGVAYSMDANWLTPAVVLKGYAAIT